MMEKNWMIVFAFIALLNGGCKSRGNSVLQNAAPVAKPNLAEQLDAALTEAEAIEGKYLSFVEGLNTSQKQTILATYQSMSISTNDSLSLCGENCGLARKPTKTSELKRRISDQLVSLESKLESGAVRHVDSKDFEAVLIETRNIFSEFHRNWSKVTEMEQDLQRLNRAAPELIEILSDAEEIASGVVEIAQKNKELFALYTSVVEARTNRGEHLSATLRGYHRAYDNVLPKCTTKQTENQKMEIRNIKISTKYPDEFIIEAVWDKDLFYFKTSLYMERTADRALSEGEGPRYHENYLERAEHAHLRMNEPEFYLAKNRGTALFTNESLRQYPVLWTIDTRGRTPRLILRKVYPFQREKRSLLRIDGEVPEKFYAGYSFPLDDQGNIQIDRLRNPAVQGHLSVSHFDRGWFFARRPGKRCVIVYTDETLGWNGGLKINSYEL